MDKQFQEGPVSLEVIVANGQVALKASINKSIGGGAAAGVIGFKNTTEIDLGADQALDLADAMLKAHFPSLAGVIDGVIAAGKGLIDKA